MGLLDQLMPMLQGGMMGATQQPAAGMQGTAQQQGNLAPFYDPTALAQLQSDQLAYQRKAQLAQQLMQTGYTPNSGKFGVFAGIASMLGGKLAQDQNDSKLSDIVKRAIEAQSQAAQAQRMQQRQDETFKTNEEIRHDTGKAQADQQYAKASYVPGIGPMDGMGKITVDPNVGATLAATQATEANATAAANAKYREAPGAGEIAGLNAKIALAQKMGASPQQIQAMITGQAGQNPETQVVGNMLVDKRTGKAVPITDPTTGQPIATGTDAKSNAVVAKAQQGLADNVIQYVAQATGTPVDTLKGMSPDQVSNEFKTKGGRSIATTLGAAAGLNGVANPNLDAFATAAQAMEARVQHPVGTIPTNAELLARKSSIGPEKTDTFNAAFIKKALEDAGHGGAGVAMPAVTAAPAAIPPAAAARLKANPAEATMFDQAFGQGAAASVLGQ